MARLAAIAATTRAAEWMIPFGADEVWLSTDGHRIAAALAECDGAAALAATNLLIDIGAPTSSLSPMPDRRSFDPGDRQLAITHGQRCGGRLHFVDRHDKNDTGIVIQSTEMGIQETRDDHEQAPIH